VDIGAQATPSEGNGISKEIEAVIDELSELRDMLRAARKTTP